MKQDKIEALTYLRKMCPPGTTIYTLNRHTSRSGMMRALDVYVMKGGTPIRISWSAALAAGLTYSRRWEAVRMDGCGMDMGYHLMMCLSYALHGNKDRGADAIESGKLGRPFTPRRGHFRAGYSLRHQWM